MSNENRKAPETISMYEHEEEVYRLERHTKRLWIALVISILLIFISNGAWLLYESMYDTISYAQDGAGINNINTGQQGDVVENEPETKNQSEEEQVIQGSEDTKE